MKILHLSDTHGQHNRLPELPWADVIIHSGDFCFGGPKREIIDFLNWFCYPPYKYKILIAGNHDDFLWDSEIEFLHENCYGLSYSCVTIEDYNKLDARSQFRSQYHPTGTGVSYRWYWSFTYVVLECYLCCTGKELV